MLILLLMINVENVVPERIYLLPLTTMTNFSFPIVNIVTLSLLTNPLHYFTFSNMTDDCMIDELFLETDQYKQTP